MKVIQVGPTIHRPDDNHPNRIGCWRTRQGWHTEPDEPTEYEPEERYHRDLVQAFKDGKVFLCRVDGCWPGRGTDIAPEGD